MDRWIEYDLVALTVLVLGVAAVEFVALVFCAHVKNARVVGLAVLEAYRSVQAPAALWARALAGAAP
jgi:hypothetical protein